MAKDMKCLYIYSGIVLLTESNLTLSDDVIEMIVNKVCSIIVLLVIANHTLLLQYSYLLVQ